MGRRLEDLGFYVVSIEPVRVDSSEVTTSICMRAPRLQCGRAELGTSVEEPTAPRESEAGSELRTVL